MSTSALSNLVQRLTDEMTLDSSEGFSTQRVQSWIIDAVKRHTSNKYTLDTLPLEHYEAVTVLASINLCYARASKVVNVGDQKGPGGFSSSYSMPYKQNIDMASSLQRRYGVLCESLTDLDLAENIHVSEISVMSPRYDGNFMANAPLVKVRLYREVVDPTFCRIRWDAPYRDDYADMIVYSSASPGIYLNTNFNTDDGIPFHSNAATQISCIQDQRIKAVEIDGLTPQTITYFAVVLKTFGGQYYYSNEIAISTPISGEIDGDDDSPDNMNESYIPFNQVGDCALASLGITEIPEAVNILAMELNLQVAPTGSGVTVDLQDNNNVSLGLTVTVPAGQTYGILTLESPIGLEEGQEIQLVVTAIGSTFPGQDIQGKLLVDFP